jgi:hypothetical protein
MKNLFLFLLVFGLVSCNNHPNKMAVLQSRIDSLETKLSNCYKPGFGEMMNSIQSHHLKLWYAGKNRNWKLAEFEIKELKEVVENIEKFQNKRKETELINMMNPALDSLTTAARQQDENLFVKSYTGLTNSCNSCHKITDFEFNTVKVPDGASPFINQDFKPKK